MQNTVTVQPTALKTTILHLLRIDLIVALYVLAALPQPPFATAYIVRIVKRFHSSTAIFNKRTS